MTTRQIAVMGLGEAGLGIHLPALAGLRDVTVIGVCDPDPGRREAARQRWRVPALETAEELLSLGPELVVVATPPARIWSSCSGDPLNGSSTRTARGMFPSPPMRMSPPQSIANAS